jgi:G3E family GTPase
MGLSALGFENARFTDISMASGCICCLILMQDLHRLRKS